MEGRESQASVKLFSVLIFLSFTLMSCEEIDISASCENFTNYQCITITSFLENFQDLYTNITLTFLPGNHHLDTNVATMNVLQLIIRPLANSSSSTDFVTPVLICNRSMIELLEIDTVKITGMNIYCNLVAIKIGEFHLTNVTIQANDFSQGYISMVDLVMNLSNSVISVPLCAFKSNLTVINSIFQNITSKNLPFSATNLNAFLKGASLEYNKGAALMAQESNIKLENIQISSNKFGALLVDTCTVDVRGKTIIMENSAEYGGGINARQSSISFEGDTKILRNKAKEAGGGFYIYKSKVTFRSQTNIEHNSAAGNGGGISAYGSQVNFYNKLVLKNNTAHENGGGLYASSTVVQFQQPGNNFVMSNFAKNGGGAYLLSNSKLILLKTKITYLYINQDLQNSEFSLIIAGNVANYRGGAIFVNDETYFSVCKESNNLYSRECFVEILQYYAYGNNFVFNFPIRFDNVQFSGNYAGLSGDLLYGGLLDRCLSSLLAENDNNSAVYNGLPYLAFISNVLPSDSYPTIASQPLSVHLCNNTAFSQSLKMIYGENITISILNGQTLTLSVIVHDQVHNSVEANLFAYLNSGDGRLSKGQAIQPITSDCTTVTYNMFSPHQRDELILYADGPCKDEVHSKFTVEINFESCPIGFEQSESSLSCECHSALQHYTRTFCDINTKSIERRDEFWVSYSNKSNKSGLVVHSYCPHDYCFPHTTPVSVKLESQEGTDAQCVFNRSGTLCGACKDEYSLVLGSSKCKQCTNNTIALVLPITVAGILLVALILLLNLTVDVGSVNGLILYSNVVTAFSSAYVPFTTPNYATAVISWLSLELGFETCLYDGMDMYARTWLELAFPTYIISIVVAIILVSERSNRFVKLLGSTNPVAVLATLILLSFARLFQTIVTILSFTLIKYPDDHTEVLWLADPNVLYLRGKHIPLFLVAAGIVILGFLYISLLTFRQVMLRCNHCLITKWLDNTRLKSFVDVYFAPFVQGYQSWSGLLLLIRAIVFFTSAFNASSDPQVNLLVVALLMFMTIAVKCMCKAVYKVHAINVFETFFLVNLGTYTVALAYAKMEDISQAPIAYVSMNLTLVMLIVIVFYHILVVKQNLKQIMSKLKREKRSTGIGKDKPRSSFDATTSTASSAYTTSTYERTTLSSSEYEQQKTTNFTELREELLS